MTLSRIDVLIHARHQRLGINHFCVPLPASGHQLFTVERQTSDILQMLTEIYRLRSPDPLCQYRNVEVCVVCGEYLLPRVEQRRFGVDYYTIEVENDCFDQARGL